MNRPCPEHRYLLHHHLISFPRFFLNFLCSSLKTTQFVLNRAKRNSNFVLWKNSSGAKSNQVAQIKEGRINTDSLALRYSKTTAHIDPAFQFRMNDFRLRPSPCFSNTRSRTSAASMWSFCSLAQPARSVARTTAALTSHSPECYPGPRTRGVPWTDIPTAKKTYVLRSTQA